MSNSHNTKIAYLISRYPAISHTFILREVTQLRALGMHIETASINLPDHELSAMPIHEKLEASRTYYVKQDGFLSALLAHLTTLFTQPGAWLQGFFYIFKLGKFDVKALLKGFAYFTEALMIGRWMKQRKLTHLHIHFATAAANVGLYVKTVFKFPLSITVHGPDEFDNVSTQFLQEKIRAADFIFCIGTYAKSQLMRLSDPIHWNKIHIAPLGVDPSRYEKKHVQYTGWPIHILCVGRLTPAKGQHILISAAQKMLQQGREFRISIVGTGPDEASLKIASERAGLSKHIHFTGALNQDAVHALYKETDIFVLPSFAEGIPVVLMEAMACGIPCISSKITGIPELIRSNDEGLLLPPSDVDSLHRALITLMSNAQLRESISHAARQRIITNFNLEKNIARLHVLFTKHLETESCSF
jgi:colanic acid/amylovoran biosynthesis glycosyltransferase